MNNQKHPIAKMLLLYNLILPAYALAISDPLHTNAQFTLITTLYNEPDQKRSNEYITCLNNNINHPCIHSIHVIYDTSQDNMDHDRNHILQFLEKNNINITYTKKRTTFGCCFHIANTFYSNKKIIVSNADIYFNDTLNLLANYNLTDKFIALTRWNVLKDNTLQPHYCTWPTPKNERNYIYSQDVWIFNTPLCQFEDETIELGTLHCDGLIAFQAHKAQLQVINPCLSIQCCHLHLSGIRHYDKWAYPKERAMTVPWTKL